MTRGLYIGASGMLAEIQRQDVIANNLANVNTTGYKRDIPLSKEFSSMLIRRIREDRYQVSPNRIIEQRPKVGSLGRGVITAGPAYDFTTPGPFVETGNRFDLAIQDLARDDGSLVNHFFTVQTESGVRYTRNGSFLLNEKNQLVTTDGNLVLGQNGPVVPTGSDVQFGEDGSVFVDGQKVDSLRIVYFAKLGNNQYPLVKVGNSMFNTDTTPRLANTDNFRIKSGFLEGSNVNVVSEMVDMITAVRAYEANQRVITAQDETIGRAISDVGHP